MKKLLFASLLLLPLLTFAEVKIIEAQSIALRGEPKYADGFTHFDYVNPDAPKGGVLRNEAIGTFDSFNRYGQRGDSVVGADALFDTLMVGSSDELDVYYPLIAERIRYADDYSFLTFVLNPAARYSDGQQITANDVLFTFEKFKAEGVPQFAKYYEFIKSVEVESDLEITFYMEGADREKFLSLIDLPVFPEHFWKDHNLSEPLKVVPVVSGRC